MPTKKMRNNNSPILTSIFNLEISTHTYFIIWTNTSPFALPQGNQGQDQSQQRQERVLAGTRLPGGEPLGARLPGNPCLSSPPAT